MTQVIHRSDVGRYYRGIPIHAASRLHEDAFGLVKKHARGKTALDIGAGSGAFSMRLKDSGFEVKALEMSTSDWPHNDIDIIEADLNTVFSAKVPDKYEIVVSLEVIEHLENPSLFLRQVKNLITARTGIFILSTPNIMNLDSRRFFITKGTLYNFQHESYKTTGHLTILPYWLLEILLEKEGFEIIERRFIGKHQRLGIRKIIPLFNMALLPLGYGIPFESAFPTNIAYVCKVNK